MLQETWKTFMYWSNSDTLSAFLKHSCVTETGLSDFYKMVATVMKRTYRKMEPIVIKYRDYKYFCNDTFRGSQMLCFTFADQTNAKVLNSLFSYFVNNLEIPQYNQLDPICQNKKYPVIKAIIKYRNHPSIIAIKKRCTNSKFSFSFIEKNDVLK